MCIRDRPGRVRRRSHPRQARRPVEAMAGEPTEVALPALLVSLLGAVARALRALQRAKNKLLTRRIMQFSAVVLALEKIKARAIYPAMECATQICARSGGSFKREKKTGCDVRGAVYMRLGKFRSTGKQICHVRDAVGRSREL
eukprot:3154153-Pyramimonas_sp.AAC.1